MISILSLLLLGYVASASKTTMRSAKDAGLAPQFNREADGSVTAVWPIMEGTYDEVEPLRRRLQQLTQAELRPLLLDKHNELRSTTAMGLAPCKCGSTCGAGHNGAGYHPGATNMNEIFWDPALEKVAQTYSDKCLFIHNDQRSNEAADHMSQALWAQTKEKYAGENLYVSSTGTKVWESKWGEDDYGIGGGLYGWWIECEDYKYPEGGSCGGQVGHYTQYIRADARFVGCGVTICPNGIATKTTTYTWAELNVVCNYMGGQYGDAPYEQANSAGDVASNCEPDRTPDNTTGLCGGPQHSEYFENPQTEYDLTQQTEANGWICNDGTGRGDNVGCGTAGTTTKRPTPYPTTTTARPTNNPVNPTNRPTQPPTTDYPTKAPVNTPTEKPSSPPTHIVTARPTTSTTTTTARPTARATKKPTGYPTTTSRPSASPVVESDSCDLSDCEFATNIQWVSENYKYQGLGGYAWNREKELINLQAMNGWRSGYSWGGSYSKGPSGGWILNIYDDIDLDFTSMECSLRDYLKEYMQTGNEFKDSMKAKILEDMIERHGANPGYVDSVTVVITCATSDAAAFGAIDEDGNVELPFSTWNLNSYDFSDWFVLLFVLFTGCACCFGCGWAMHRRRVFKAMDDASISDFNGGNMQDTPMVTMDGNASPHIHVNQHHVADNSNYGDAVMHNTNEPEIEIGVSVNSNNHGIMAEDSE